MKKQEPLGWSAFVALLLVPFLGYPQIISLSSASGIRMKSLGNGNKLLVAKKVFGASDSTYLVTMTADDAWNVASVGAERVYPTGEWLMMDAAPTNDGMMITGLRPGNPEN